MSIEALKKALKEGKGTYGIRETLKKIKQGKVTTVFLAKNCKDAVRERMHYYKKQGELTIVELEINGNEVGTLCKKQFSISVLSF